jgi:hypothetical protein
VPFAVLKDKKLLKRIISTSGQAKEGGKGLIGLWTNKQKDFETIKKRLKLVLYFVMEPLL